MQTAQAARHGEQAAGRGTSIEMLAVHAPRRRLRPGELQHSELLCQPLESELAVKVGKRPIAGASRHWVEMLQKLDEKIKLRVKSPRPQLVQVLFGQAVGGVRACDLEGSSTIRSKPRKIPALNFL